MANLGGREIFPEHFVVFFKEAVSKEYVDAINRAVPSSSNKTIQDVVSGHLEVTKSLLAGEELERSIVWERCVAFLLALVQYLVEEHQLVVRHTNSPLARPIAVLQDDSRR